MSSAAIKQPIVQWLSVRGMNDADAPAELPDDMAVEAINIELVRWAIAKRRNGSTQKTFSGSSFTGYAQIARFQPGQNEAAAEFHIVSNDSKILRVAAGSSASNLSLTDAISTRPQDAHYAVLNGKLYWAYDSPVNRLHVFDPAGSTTAVRRVGLAAPSAPTAADGGGGGFDVNRYYRIMGMVKSGANIRRMSNLGTALLFNPAAANSVTVTAPSFTEGETHWRVYGSIDGDAYYLLTSDIVVATTTYSDTADPNDYADGDAAPEEGANTPPPSARYLLSDGNRLLMFGAWETATGSAMPPKDGRVWFSPVLDTTEQDDDERVSNSLTIKGYIDLSRNAGGTDRAIAGPIDGQILVFFSKGIWMLVPTGNATVPYKRYLLSPSLGAVNQWSTFVGEDENGAPCIYFLDPSKGPYRYGKQGFQWVGYDCQTFWSTVNLAAANRVAIGLWNPVRRRAEWQVARGNADDPSHMLVFHAAEGEPSRDGVRYGLVRWDGLLATARCCTMFSTTFGATMSYDQRPYYGLAPGTGGEVLLQADDSSSVTDNATRYDTSITSKAWELPPQMTKKKLGAAWVQAKAPPNGPIVPPGIRLTLIRNYGDVTNVTDTVTLPQVSATRLLRKFNGLFLSDIFTLQFKIEDEHPASTNALWVVDRVMATFDTKSEEFGNNQP